MMRPRYILATELYEYLAAWKAACAKQSRSRAAQGIADFCDEQIAHFGLTPGAQLTVIRDE